MGHVSGFSQSVWVIYKHDVEDKGKFNSELGYVEVSGSVFTFTNQDTLKATDEFLVVAAGNRLFLFTPK